MVIIVTFKLKCILAFEDIQGLQKVLIEESGFYFHEPYENLADYNTEVTGTNHWQKMYLLLCFGQEHESTINLGRRFSTLSVELD